MGDLLGVLGAAVLALIGALDWFGWLVVGLVALVGVLHVVMLVKDGWDDRQRRKKYSSEEWAELQNAIAEMRKEDEKEMRAASQEDRIESWLGTLTTYGAAIFIVLLLIPFRVSDR